MIFTEIMIFMKWKYKQRHIEKETKESSLYKTGDKIYTTNLGE